MSLENYIKIGELLCNIAPDMINMENDNGEKPLEFLRKKLTQDLLSVEKEKLRALIPVFENCERMYNEQLRKGIQNDI